MRIKAPIWFCCIASIGLSFWQWYPHLICVFLCWLILRGILASARSISPALAEQHFSAEMKQLSPAAQAWFRKNAHAVVMWGAARDMSILTAVSALAAVVSVVVVAIRFSPWFLLELPLYFGLNLLFFPIRRGFQACNPASFDPRDTPLRNEVTEIANRFLRSDLMHVTEEMWPNNLTQASSATLPVGAEFETETSSKPGKVAVFRAVNGEYVRIFLGSANLEDIQVYMFETQPGAEFLRVETKE